MSPTLLDVSRWQFIITIVFHMTFPAIMVGLSVFLTVVYGLHLRTGQVIYLQIFRFWKRIFAVAKVREEHAESLRRPMPNVR